MFKSPVNENININENYTILLSGWNNFNNDCDTFINNSIEQIFRNIKNCLFEKIMPVISCDSAITKCDERIYDYYHSLINYYKNTVDIYNKNKESIVSESISKILSGLYSVLVSQIKQFNELNSIANVKNERGKRINPIYAEKKVITRNNIKLFSNKIDIIKNKVCKNDISKYKEILFDIIYNENNIYNMPIEMNKYIIDINSNEFYIIYKETIKKCINELNDLNSRDILNFYFDMLKEEKDNLGSVIKIQIDALEKEIQTKDEEEIILKILYNLREAYQRICKQMKIIEENFKVRDNKNSILKFESNNENFKNNFIGNFEIKNDTFEDYIKNINKSFFNFKKLFDENVCILINCISLNAVENNEEINNIVENENNIAFDLINIFNEIISYTNDNVEVFENTEYKEIIMGILETIQIKVESIDENRNIFVNECQQELEKYKSIEINISEEEIKTACNNLFKQWFEIEEKNDFLESCIKKYIYDNFYDKIIKQQEKHLFKINKLSLQFKREQLLFEICTFEEIINYSISRLRNSENEDIMQYVSKIDNISESIYNMLLKYNIKTIIPKAHDLFNGKEHEVLIAEKNDEFKKGEIIKLMNSGYKQGDTVILRANVIAAK